MKAVLQHLHQFHKRIHYDFATKSAHGDLLVIYRKYNSTVAIVYQWQRFYIAQFMFLK